MKQLMKGNEAIAEAAIRGGCRAFFGYPITPQNEIPEYMSWRLFEVGGTFVQAESEVASINMLYGACGAGARAMTSSSSPGISLMQEGISYICCAQIPCVIVNMVRGGPGLGGIQPAQGDYFQATKGGGHGDYHMIVYGPSSVQECVDIMYDAFDTADKYRVPVMILGDGMLGQIMEPVELPEMNYRIDDATYDEESDTIFCTGKMLGGEFSATVEPPGPNGVLTFSGRTNGDIKSNYVVYLKRLDSDWDRDDAPMISDKEYNIYITNNLPNLKGMTLEERMEKYKETGVEVDMSSFLEPKL